MADNGHYYDNDDGCARKSIFRKFVFLDKSYKEGFTERKKPVMEFTMDQETTMVKEFIEGWDLMQILGEGTFAEVKLLVNRSTGEACAVKEVDLSRAFLNKENDFIFLEYCSGGELFDRIEPDKGMPEFQAQGYFNQLIAGVEYLHVRGVAHRDIKPENLLLTDNDVLKISDFGMATVFRHKGEERSLERRCGTRPYMAPEILMKSNYSAEPSDIWSCGVVLVAMLAGV
ncbi:CHEK1 [Lepeophtheirus salmonis]|uniref:non-specific serine/threonine protein kinase n=1 Tax=Lepeophtheirus salmonis TaxID=72036 RepID=A0A7R8H642_LEPSM|nr:CHEK1 [Lepeophtheirus salmonis]CAF2889788.1 CHEK1 [Lepeophtheirus salmonis]